ncbi:putative glycoside hydrolase [Paenibacillus aurantius]|uniref:Glycoside hydrolase n=1 Tax=Paenibacillus aurantius TaxID=2918900 RepID=A0AA96LCS4_9BACL|nr:putative glycoside hydrolase [Paenibacillus aurantius]WNQ10950.1 putative glycoside hydrolase [Paenibacillus aurantius]
MRKKRIAITWILAVLAMMGCSTQKGASDYIIYYGPGDDQAVSRLSGYSLAVIEPRHFSKEGLQELRRAGTVLYGYVSFVEQNENSPDFRRLKEEWYYQDDGKKQKNPEWNSWIMDLRKNSYREFLMDTLREEIIGKGLDGVLIDTVGDIDDFPWNEEDKAGMREGYWKLLEQIRNEFPGLKLIQNWGFQTALTTSQEYLDGIMWENFSWSSVKRDEWSRVNYEAIRRSGLSLYVVSSKPDEAPSQPTPASFHRFYNKDSVYNELN